VHAAAPAEPLESRRETILRIAEDVARPVLYHNRSGTCWQSYVKGYTPMVNSIYNGMRMEQVWLDR